MDDYLAFYEVSYTHVRNDGYDLTPPREQETRFVMFCSKDDSSAKIVAEGELKEKLLNQYDSKREVRNPDVKLKLLLEGRVIFPNKNEEKYSRTVHEFVSRIQ